MDYSLQAPLPVGFSRQVYWSELSCPPPGDLPHPGIKPISLMSPALAGKFFTTSTTWEAFNNLTIFCFYFFLLYIIVILFSHLSIYIYIYLYVREVAQSCPTLCDPMDCSLPGSSVHGIFQAIVLEWIAISFSNGSSQPRDRTRVSRIVDRRFNVWATREIIYIYIYVYIINLSMLVINSKLSLNKIFKIAMYVLHFPICFFILSIRHHFSSILKRSFLKQFFHIEEPLVTNFLRFCLLKLSLFSFSSEINFYYVYSIR